MSDQVAHDGRIDGLYTWRAALMLGGLLTHATLGWENIYAMAFIANVSHAFRMGVFFVISGFLSGHSLRRRPAAELWLVHRLVRLGVPTLFGIGILSPVISFFIHLNPEAKGPTLLLDWYHLWFLVALLIYSALAYIAHYLDRRHDLFRSLDHAVRTWRTGQARTLLGLAFLSLLLMTMATYVIEQLAPAEHIRTFMQWRLIIGYAPLFVLGIVLARSPAARAALTDGVRLPATILTLAGLAYAGWYLLVAPLGLVDDAAAVDLALTNLGAAFCPPAAAALILRSSLRIRRVPALVHDLSDASFTMYVLHYPLIVATKAALAHLAWSVWIEFAISVCVGGVFSYGFHRLVVRRSPTASLLLNGRLRQPIGLGSPGQGRGPQTESS